MAFVALDKMTTESPKVPGIEITETPGLLPERYNGIALSEDPYPGLSGVDLAYQTAYPPTGTPAKNTLSDPHQEMIDLLREISSKLSHLIDK